MITYTCDEMVEMACLVNSLKKIFIVFSPSTLADTLAAYAPRIVEPECMDTLNAGLAKLKTEPLEKLSALLAGRAEWYRGGADEFCLVWRQPAGVNP